MSAPATSHRDIVLVGASAGGVEALLEVAARLPSEFPASVLVVLHVMATGTSVLDAILSRSGNLPAVVPNDGQAVARGQIYVAPPDRHMLLNDGHLTLSRGPRENGHRPAIDPLFRSAGRSVGPRAIGVILSGALDDGAAGLKFLRERGALAVVQDPRDALYPSMPQHALDAAGADRVVPAAGVADVLCSEVERPLERDALDRWQASLGPDRVEADPSDFALVDGPPTGLTCPECGGALWEEADGPIVRFTCHVGHSYSAESLVSEQGQALESALWSGVRALEERAGLLERMAGRASLAPRSARHFSQRSRDAREHARALRDLLVRLGREVTPPQADGAEGSG